MYFTSNDGYKTFLLFPSMLRSLILDSNAKVTDWISTGISSGKIKPIDAGLQPIISYLCNGRVYLKFNNSVVAQKLILHCIATLF